MWRTYLKHTMKHLKVKCKVYTEERVCPIYSLYFADYQINEAQDYKKIKNTIRNLNKKSINKGLREYVDKRKYICIGNSTGLDSVEITNCQIVKSCDSYKS